MPGTKVAQFPSVSRGVKGFARQIAPAKKHTAILNEQGQIYMAGSLMFGKTGINSTITNFREFRLNE